MMRLALVACGCLALAGPAAAQHNPGGHGGGHGGHQAAPGASPYAGLERRAVASLSEEQIADLRAGRGMGFALSAELNGYPGPLHVLELASQLKLPPDQASRIQALHSAMKADAIPLGERLIAQERELDAAFRERTITPERLAQMTQAIAATQGALRQTHLKYHLATVEVLTPEQVARYNQLRGYASR